MRDGVNDGVISRAKEARLKDVVEGMVGEQLLALIVG